MDQHSPVPVPATYPSDALDRRLLLGAAGLAGIAALAAGRAQAGPLTPPAGPVVSTGKTITEAEPRIAINATNTPGHINALYAITQPGSYYLTGNINLTGTPSWVRAVSVGVPGVTVDLNGFTISNGSVGVEFGNNCTVRNGRVMDLQYGIEGLATQNCVVEDVVAVNCSERSIRVGGRGVIRRCHVANSGNDAITLGGGTIEDCQVFTSFRGITLEDIGAVRRCLVRSCVTGVSVWINSLVEGCSVEACTESGIIAGARSRVAGCCVVAPVAIGVVGIGIGDGATLCDTSVVGGQFGVRTASATRVTGCAFDGSTTALKLLAGGNIIESCTFTRNATGVDMLNVGGNYVHKCVMLGNTNSIAVNVGGNWYPNVLLGGVNTASNPLATVIG